jgi:hypothetical protein
MYHLARTLLLLLLLCHVPGSWADDADPAQVAIGERLFLETRFSQFFLAHAGGNPNATLTQRYRPHRRAKASGSRAVRGPGSSTRTTCWSGW